MIKTCQICGSEFKTKKKNQKTCSKVCMGKNQTGKNNPNFGNRWTDEQRSHASLLKSQQFKDSPQYAQECGKSNRGVKFTKERIQAMHEHRTSESYSRPHTDESKARIGRKSKEKWTDEYRAQHREKMELSGHWVPANERDPYELFYKESNWVCNMVEHFSECETARLEESGIFSSKNTKGWVRDHIVSRMIGYEFQIPAKILRHPANLQFISHSDNVKKGFVERRLTKIEKTCIIEDLIEKIKTYSGHWFEHNECLQLITKMGK